MSYTQQIYVSNHSTVLADAAVLDALPAFQAAVSIDFKRHWNQGATLHFIGANKAATGAWEIALLDDSDTAGALGYHDVDAVDVPLGKVFARTDAKYGLSWQVTFTHELFELLADPRVNRAEQTSATQFTALEVGDPCEGDQFAYVRKSLTGREVKISDFITERWFAPGMPGPYDFAGHCSKALEVLPDGYVSIYDAVKRGWTQFQQKAGELVPTKDGDDPDRPRIRPPRGAALAS